VRCHIPSAERKQIFLGEVAPAAGLSQSGN
jgi:hypothetical protein